MNVYWCTNVNISVSRISYCSVFGYGIGFTDAIF